MAFDNPYHTAMLPETTVEPRRPSASLLVLLCYGATVVSGAVFGIWAGPLGLLFGGIFAGITGLLPFAIALPFCAVIESGQKRLLVMLACGGITGFLAVTAVFGRGGIGTDVLLFAVAASSIGGAASAVTAWLLDSADA